RMVAFCLPFSIWERFVGCIAMRFASAFCDTPISWRRLEGGPRDGVAPRKPPRGRRTLRGRLMLACPVPDRGARDVSVLLHEKVLHMTTMGIVGAGVAGLHLALYLQKHGVPVTLYAERSPDEVRAGRLLNTQALLGAARARTVALGVNHW